MQGVLFFIFEGVARFDSLELPFSVPKTDVLPIRRKANIVLKIRKSYFIIVNSFCKIIADFTSATTARTITSPYKEGTLMEFFTILQNTDILIISILFLFVN